VLTAYAAALVVVFGAAAGVGAAVGPVGTADEPPSRADHSATAGEGGHGGGQAHSEPVDVTATGLGVAQDGFVLRLERSVLDAGVRTPFRFVVEDEDGEPVTEYRTAHDKELHLVVARRDLTGFQHVHPTRGSDGSWTVPLELPEAGPYKVFADFTPQDRETSVVLAADLTVPGEYSPGPAPARVPVAEVDGYSVELDGELVAGTRSELTLPAAATYRLFLDFRHGDGVRTAALTATASTRASGR
jgi:hypothetical protein